MGRGGATTFQQDLANSDCIVDIGSNMAENHPVGFQWVMEARLRGADIIHVDPRYTRTSAVSNFHVPIRSGTDIAFLGGMIRHVIETEGYFRDYVVNYTNAPTILREDFQDTEDLGGLFSGFDPETATYDPATWQYENAGVPRDDTLEHPRCVFQVLRRHFARYTPEFVERVCGISPQDFRAVADALVRNSGRERTTALCYAVGWTQHTAGVQIIRTAAILQLLLGNIGRPGGGIMALRGHASIQGSTDIPTLFDILPGYLEMPRAGADPPSLHDHVDASGKKRGWWAFYETYLVSLLKAWFGDAATPGNEFGFAHLPKLTGNHSHFATMLRALDGGLEGLFLMGQNPAVGSQHSGLQRRALASLKWLVVRDLAEIESATFWRDSPEVQSGELRMQDIQTEVFLMPAASHVEKEGAFTNTQRLLQWRDKALDPPGDARSELWFMHHLARRVRAHYAGSQRERDWPIRNLSWDYPEHGEIAEPDVEAVAREINGYDVATGDPLPAFTALKDDGSTACGCWIYSGYFEDGVNQARRRDPGDLTAPGGVVSPEWGWAWPLNRRILYNRASADPEGRPWSERKRYVWWDDRKQRWTGYDVPDFPPDKRPDYQAPPGALAMDAISGDDPFIMLPDGRGWLFAPSGLLDGPLPTHYEPFESPFEHPLYPQLHMNPAAVKWQRPENPYNASGDPRYPIVATSFRLTEHHTAGAMSRNLPWLAELQPEMFAELDPALAADRGIEDGGWMTIETSRGEIEARARVTPRVRPLKLDGRVVHQVCLPWHWGFTGAVRGDSTNDLGALSGDPNVNIQESKAFSCNVRAGRRERPTTVRLANARLNRPIGPAEDDPPAEYPSETT
ncbi:MAG: formate dehydrogenase-N subunit alpha [Actinobacteria bacterium]|nr:formate dehydrogenase-N subunit alpha [Actinomycetota bacterium]